MIDRIVVLGGAGDLATRHLLAALAHLLAAGEVPDELRVVGVGREPLTRGSYRQLATARLAEQAPTVARAHREALVARLDYLVADLDQRADLASAVGSAPVVAHLALPPAAYPGAVHALHAAGVAPGSRIVVEKPFGEDGDSARVLSRLLHTVVDERDVFRVDHFLHHQSVRDLLALRIMRPGLEPVWDAAHVERVDITWEETVSVGRRGDFYDRTGALRDMVQSHLLQLLALLAMEAPAALDEASLRDAKSVALQGIRALTMDEVGFWTARGRYTAGVVEGEPRDAYVDEPGVDAARHTETYAYVRLDVDVPRWRGVPFALRTGKALGRPLRRITVRFRPGAGPLSSDRATVLSLEMGPGPIRLDLRVLGARGLSAHATVGLEPPEAALPGRSVPASARLVRDVLAGDPTFAVRDDETEQSWRVVDSVLAGWQAGTPGLQDYAAGSPGPRLPGGWSTNDR